MDYRSGVLLASAVFLASCSESTEPNYSDADLNADAGSSDTDIATAAENAASNVPVTPVRNHNYDFKDGDLYGYIAAISEEEQKVGKAAGDVVTYRYVGFWDAAHHIELVGDNSAILSVSDCSMPCVAIKTYSNGTMRRVAYNPASVVGAAMQDAMSGKLARKRPPPVLRPTESIGPISPANQDGDAPENNETL